jgi:DNA-binding NarL/FixJ family response regulator
MAEAEARVASPGVLIVEDDWLVANGLREMLRQSGHRVIGVASRADQVEPLVRAHAPALALVDIRLARGGDGIAVARDLLGGGTRVVFTSAHADEATLARAREVGAHGFVVKPYTQKQLRAAIAVALGERAPAASADEAALELLQAAQQALAGAARALAGRAAPMEVAVRLKPDARLASLSEREREVVLGLLEHRRVPAIAAHLGVSAHTVRNHLKSIFVKLRVSSQQELLDQLIDRSPGQG